MSIENIAAALSAFQGEMPTVTKATAGQVGPRKYNYADLADVMKAAAPILSKHGLAYSCRTERIEGGQYELVGMLLHSSGETLIGAFPLFGNSPQELGSSITYGRRYLLGCLTGIVTDDDDDGAAATASGRTSRQPTADELKSEARARAWAAWKEAGFEDNTDTFRATYESDMGKSFNTAAAVDFEEFERGLKAGTVTAVDPTEAFQRSLGAHPAAGPEVTE